jgi:hypothetical protein
LHVSTVDRSGNKGADKKKAGFNGIRGQVKTPRNNRSPVSGSLQILHINISIKLRKYNWRCMPKSIGIFCILLCIAVITVAGCTSSSPAPQTVYVTVLVTPTLTVTPQVTTPTVSPALKLDEEFLAYFNTHEIIERMKVLMAASPGVYTIDTGYNSQSKAEAIELTDLILKAPAPGSEKMYAFRKVMLNALSLMDGTTAGFSRYQDAMQTVIKENNAILSDLHAAGSSIVDETHIRGYGSDVRWYNTTETGLNIFTMRHEGDSNFAITIRDEDDKYILLLVNEIGEFEGKKSEGLKAGNYSLDITADGDWTIDITSG